MSSRQFVAIALRIFALWVGLKSIQSLFAFALVPQDISLGIYLMEAITYGVLALALWMFPVTIAARILQPTPDERPMNVTSHGVVQSAVIAAGLMLLVQAIPDLLKTIAFAFSHPILQDEGVRFEFILHLLSPAVQIVIAAMMILRAAPLVRRITPEQGRP